MQCTTLYGYEQREVGERSGELALALLQRACPALQGLETGDQSATSLEQRVQAFRRFAEPRALPADTRAIIAAAERRSIPCIKLDRPPFEPPADGARIRLHSTLQTGHGCYQHTIDSNFCVDRGVDLWPLLRDRVAIWRLLSKLALPLPSNDSEPRACATANRARRIARQLDYPLMLRLAIKTRRGGDSVVIADEEALSAVFSAPGHQPENCLLEPLVSGNCYKSLVVGGEFLAIVAAGHGPGAGVDCSHLAHPSLVDSIKRVARSIEVGMLVLTLVTPDLGAPLAESGAAFVDLDIAPQLDSFLAEDSDLLARAAEGFVSWLYPPGSPAEIPLLAVAGTNGKTTTSRLIYTMLQRDGRSPGLACTDGIYTAQGKALRKGDLSGVVGHYPLLTDSSLDCAVLETARGGALKQGLSFSHCTIGVCLNVGEDHLEERGINTLAQMAAVKRSIVERAREVVVLNADDASCIAMLPFPATARICLVSMEQNSRSLRQQYGADTCLSLLETVNDEEYLVIYDGDEKLEIAAVNDIPITFNGAARHNIYNALHASVSGYLLGVRPDIISSALCQFEANFETAPGRLNFYEDLSFRVLLDYAHNAHGARQLCRFLESVETPGRRILVFSGNSDVPDYSIAELAEVMADHFDRYFCFMYRGTPEDRYGQVVKVVTDTLVRCGTPREYIDQQDTCVDAVGAAFAQAREGDLVVVISGGMERAEVWERITSDE